MTIEELEAENAKLRWLVRKLMRLCSLGGALFFAEERNAVTDEMAANHFKLCGRIVTGQFLNPFDEAIEQLMIENRHIEAVRPMVRDYVKREAELYEAGKHG